MSSATEQKVQMPSLKEPADYHRQQPPPLLSSTNQTCTNKDVCVAPPPPNRWRKVLYDTSQKFADNYTPHAYFLDAIERNKNLHKYSISECLNGACQVAIQFILVMAFYASYFAIKSQLMDSIQFLCLIASVCIGCYAILFHSRLVFLRPTLKD